MKDKKPFEPAILTPIFTDAEFLATSAGELPIDDGDFGAIHFFD